MKRLWLTYAAKINALKLRERLLVFGAALAIVLFLMDSWFIDPVTKRSDAFATRTAQRQSELDALQLEIKKLEQARSNVDGANLARRDSLKRELGAIEATVAAAQQGLVPAEQMKTVLQEMLARNPQLQLISMRTLPVTPLVEKPAKAEKAEVAAPAARGQPAPGEGGVFKRGVQITIQGSYADLHDYLDRLEKLSWRMFWSRASLDADEYPRLTLTVTIYTLSLDKAWLVV